MAAFSQILFLLTLTTTAFADPIRDIKDFKIIFSTKDKLNVVTIDYATLPQKSTLSVISPHPRMNPKKLTEDWSGTLVSDLFKTHKVPYTDSSVVSIVATDYYSTEIKGGNVRNLSLLLATHKNKKKIEFFEGGPQLVYPLKDKKIPEDFKNDAWWVWYVGAIYVGDVQPVIFWKAKGKESKSVNFDQVNGPFVNLDKPKLTQGKRMSKDPTNINAVTAITIEDFCKSQKSSCDKGVKVTDALGKSLTVARDQFQGKLIFKWNKNNIPTGYGGPVQYCTTGGECLFHILEVQEES